MIDENDSFLEDILRKEVDFDASNYDWELKYIENHFKLGWYVINFHFKCLGG